MTARLRLLASGMGLMFCGAALADSPDDSHGRYALSPVDGGIMRLDKETGAMALCTRKTDQWLCESVQDRTHSESDTASRLEAENKSLKERIKVLEDSLAIAEEANKTGTPNSESPGSKMQLPSEEEVDKALDYVERIFKKFRDRAQKYEQPQPPQTPGGEHSAPL